MIQIMIKGRIVDFKENGGGPGAKKTSTLALEVRTYRQGTQGTMVVYCAFDQYWTERLEKLDTKTKYLTVRGSDVTPTHEADVKGTVHDFLWIKAEEFFL